MKTIEMGISSIKDYYIYWSYYYISYEEYTIYPNFFYTWDGVDLN